MRTFDRKRVHSDTHRSRRVPRAYSFVRRLLRSLAAEEPLKGIRKRDLEVRSLLREFTRIVEEVVCTGVDLGVVSVVDNNTKVYRITGVPCGKKVSFTDNTLSYENRKSGSHLRVADSRMDLSSNSSCGRSPSAPPSLPESDSSQWTTPGPSEQAKCEPKSVRNKFTNGPETSRGCCSKKSTKPKKN